MLVKIEPKIEQDIKPNIGVKCQNCGQEKLPEVDPENVAGGVKFQCENCIAISSVRCWTVQPTIDSSICHTVYDADFDEPEMDLDANVEVGCATLDPEVDPLTASAPNINSDLPRKKVKTELKNEENRENTYQKQVIKVFPQNKSLASQTGKSLLRNIAPKGSSRRKQTLNTCIECTNCKRMFSNKYELSKHLATTYNENQKRVISYTCKPQLESASQKTLPETSSKPAPVAKVQASQRYDSVTRSILDCMDQAVSNYRNKWMDLVLSEDTLSGDEGTASLSDA